MAYRRCAAHFFARAVAPPAPGFLRERRLADYEQLSQLLLTRATKVRRIKEAVPLLVLKVDSAGYVKGVDVDRARTHFGLTTRSRKIILQTLRDNDFRVREAYDYFQQPRPLHEKLVATRYQLSAASRSASRFLFGWALYHKAKKTTHPRGRRHGSGTYRSS